MDRTVLAQRLDQLDERASPDHSDEAHRHLLNTTRNGIGNVQEIIQITAGVFYGITDMAKTSVAASGFFVQGQAAFGCLDQSFADISSSSREHRYAMEIPFAQAFSIHDRAQLPHVAPPFEASARQRNAKLFIAINDRYDGTSAGMAGHREVNAHHSFCVMNVCQHHEWLSDAEYHGVVIRLKSNGVPRPTAFTARSWPLVNCCASGPQAAIRYIGWRLCTTPFDLRKSSVASPI